MGSSIRAPPPLPLNLGSSTSNPIPIESPNMLDEKLRVNSYSSLDSNPDSPPTVHRTNTWVKPSPTVNVYTTCGRHTDQLLFGGPSLTELARSIIRRR